LKVTKACERTNIAEIIITLELAGYKWSASRSGCITPGK